MQRALLLLTCALTLAACQDRPDPAAPDLTPQSRASTLLDPALSGALAGATDADTFEVIINFDEALTTRDAVTSAVLELGAGVIQFKHLSLLAVRATRDQILAAEALAGVEGLYLNEQLKWYNAEGVASIRADEVHDLGVTGEGVGVAILDSGIDGFHKDVEYGPNAKTIQNIKYVANLSDEFHFKGKQNKLKKAANIWIEGVQNSETSIGHGTHVAGTVAGTGASSDGKYAGVAPGANLIGIGAGDGLWIFWALAGYDWLLDNHATYNIKIVNNSWGSDGAFDPKHPINEASRKAYKAGILSVFAGGNSGPGENTMNRYSVAPWVISVAAGCKLTDPDPTGSAVHCEDPTGAERAPVLADFSSRGIPGDDLYHPDVTAPGVHIVSVRASTGTVMNGLDANHDARICAISVEHQPYYTCASGTSMAAPHVAGLAALLQQAGGNALTPDQLIDIITSTARPLEGYEVWEVGAGYADALAAVQKVMGGNK